DIELFRFSDGTFTKADLDYLTNADHDIAWDVANSDGSKSTLGWRPAPENPAHLEAFIQRRSIDGELMSETVFKHDGSRRAYAWDVLGTESWKSYVQTFDANADLIAHVVVNDDD